MKAPPTMVRRPRRLTAPASLSGGSRPLLEQVHQPLYSAVALDNAVLPAELNFFTYAKGQAVPGAGNASGGTSTLYHTNLESPGALPQPKVFTVSGIRLFMPVIAFSAAQTPALSDAAFGAAAANANLLLDLQAIVTAGVLRMFVGPKDYANHPAFFFPSNTGFAGLSAQSQDNGTAATTGELDQTLPHVVGAYWGMPVYPVVIASQQTFGAQISFTWATNPTMVNDRILFCFLDGVLSREVS